MMMGCVNPDSWKDEFLEYDYVGAPWEYLIITTQRYK
jgi:hypothetical protein